MRVWAGKPTLATEQGVHIKSFEHFERWLKSQPDGQIEVWAGRWWRISAEDCLPFTVKDGKAGNAHPQFRSHKGLNAEDYPGFFAFEAWKRACKTTKFYFGIDKLTEGMLKAAKDE